MDSVWREIRSGCRVLAKRPAASVVVVAILACALATATVLGALFAAVVHDLPPIDAPGDVGHVWLADETMPAGHRAASAADFLAWTGAARTLTDLTAVARDQAILGDADGRPISVLFVTTEYFRLTGRSPRWGRPFNVAEARDAGSAIISDRLWRERFNGDAAIVGQTVRIDAEPHVIVGVMPEDFWFPSRGVDVWLPFTSVAPATVDIVGRLQTGRSWTDVQAEFDVLARTRTLVRSLQQEELIRLRPGLQGFGLPALAVLLIACANVGNLLVMRLAARRREFAIRAALGATPFSLARLSFVEASILIVLAGAVGLVLAAWAIAALRIAASAIPGLAGALRIDSIAVAVAAVATVVTILGVAPLPALSAARSDILSALAGRDRRPISTRFQYGVGDVLVVVQIGLAVALVLTSAFMVRLGAEVAVVSRPPESDHLLVTQITAARTVSVARRVGAFERLVDEAQGASGVDAAALTTALPQLAGQPRLNMSVGTSGGETTCRVKVSYVTPGFFRALGLTFRSGSAGPGLAAIASESAATRCLGGSASHSARARATVDASHATPWIPVTGVVTDPFTSTMSGTADAASYVWIVGAHDWPATVYLLTHTAASAAASKGSALRPVPGIATDAWSTFEARTGSGALWFVIDVLGAVALLALLLAFTGVYAAMSQSCAVRLVDLGIRLALGADLWRLVASAVARDAPLVIAGLATGLVGTVWVTSVVWRDLLVINALDARVWIGVSAILAAAVLLATMGPVLRAVRVDPIVVLRAD